MPTKRKPTPKSSKRDIGRDQRREIAKSNHRAGKNKPTLAKVVLPEPDVAPPLPEPVAHWLQAGGGELVWLANPTGGKPIPERWPHDAPVGVKHGTVIGRTRLDDKEMILSLDVLASRYPPFPAHISIMMDATGG